MPVVIDASALVAGLRGEVDRDARIAATIGVELLAPSSVHWEIGSALSEFPKRKRLTLGETQRALIARVAIPIRFLEVDLALKPEIAAEPKLSAYDAYLIPCALTQRAPLLTVDVALQRAATPAGGQLVESIA